MKKIIIILLMPIICNSQVKIKEYVPSAIFAVLGGATDGVRDASMFGRMKGWGDFWDGRYSFLRKYKNKDPKQGAAYWGSRDVLVWTTDAPHMFNMFTHQFNSWGFVFMPEDKNRKFGHLLLKGLAFRTLAQIGHYLTYDIILKPKN